MGSLKRLVHEIHRRSLWQVVGIYLAGSWVALQVVEQLAEAASLPEWVHPLALVLLVIGMPVVVATAFVQEGLGSDRSVEDGAPSGTGSSGEIEAPSLAVSALTWKNTVLFGIGAIALWGLVALAWVLRGGSTADANRPNLGAAELQARVAAIASRANGGLPTVAVLPFEFSGSEDQAFFAEGVHDDLLTNLSKIESLIVLARAAVMSYRDVDGGIARAASELGATAVVTGSVRRVDQQVRVNVQLIDPVTSRSLWAESYDRELRDIFAVQTEIALAVTGELEAELTAAERSRLAEAPTDDMTAFDLYTRGRVEYHKYNAPGIEASIRLFREAVARDPGYARAWAGLADAYAQAYTRAGAGQDALDSALVAGGRAIELSPESSEAQKAIGVAHLVAGRDLEAIAANERALDLDPNNPGSANNLAILYESVGRPSDAIRLYGLAAKLQPHVFAESNMADTYSYMGFPERAREVAAAEDAAVGESYGSIKAWGWAAVSAGDWESARDYAARAIAIMEGDDTVVSARSALQAFWGGFLDEAEEWGLLSIDSPNRGDYYIKNGLLTLGQVALARGDSAAATPYVEESLVRMRELEDRGGNDSWLHYQFAVTHAVRGDTDDAIARARIAVDRGLIYQIFWELEPAFDNVRAEPRFAAIMEAARTRWNEERARIAQAEGLTPTP